MAELCMHEGAATGRSVRETFQADSEAHRRLLLRCKRIAQQEGPVLIMGETGTGKTMLARELHTFSKRAQGPFRSIGCGEIDHAMIESALFGHTRDAYTGAESFQEGLLAGCHGGTLVLNDLDFLPLRYQTRLLQFLDNGSFFRLGRPNDPVRANVRLVVTSNKDLFRLSNNNQFLPDLYYRLKRWRLFTIPLRKRPEDICLLAEDFLRRFQRHNEPDAKDWWSFHPEALDLLCSLRWLGNVRELREAVENIALFADGPKSEISISQAAKVLFDPEYSIDAEYEPAIGEPDTLHKVLRQTNWNISLASRIVGMSRTTIYKRIEQEGWHRR